MRNEETDRIRRDLLAEVKNMPPNKLRIAYQFVMNLDRKKVELPE